MNRHGPVILIGAIQNSSNVFQQYAVAPAHADNKILQILFRFEKSVGLNIDEKRGAILMPRRLPDIRMLDQARYLKRAQEALGELLLVEEHLEVPLPSTDDRCLRYIGDRAYFLPDARDNLAQIHRAHNATMESER